VFVVVFSFVSANAIWYQPGAHPAPLLVTRTDDAGAPRVMRPVETAMPKPAIEDPSQVSARQQTIEDILTPVPATRVATTRIQPSDGMPTASIAPAPADRVAVDPVERTRETTRRVQAELARLGYYDDAVDGLMGPKTRAALGAYASAQGLAGEPSVDEALVERLRAARPAQMVMPEDRPAANATDGVALSPAPPQTGVDTPYIPQVTVPPEPSTSLASAEAPSQMVMEIQRGLVNIAYSRVEVDGVAGSETRAAIRDFESHYRLPETGEPSSVVLDKLREIGAL
jgi:peptidoglycan hydrolase-like protein with peptidoglycan-binding domain